MKSSVPAIASRRLSWPCDTLSHSGVLASSWSASHTFAPELSALMVILRVGRAGDLDPAVDQARRRLGHPPVVLADVLGLGQEAERAAGGELRLALLAGGEQLAPAGVEARCSSGDQRQGAVGEHLAVPVLRRSVDADAVRAAECLGHAPSGSGINVRDVKQAALAGSTTPKIRTTRCGPGALNGLFRGTVAGRGPVLPKSGPAYPLPSAGRGYAAGGDGSPLYGGSGAHSLAFSPKGDLLVASSLLDDMVFVYRLGAHVFAEGGSSPFATGNAPASGALSPSGRLYADVDRGADTVFGVLDLGERWAKPRRGLALRDGAGDRRHSGVQPRWRAARSDRGRRHRLGVLGRHERHADSRRRLAIRERRASARCAGIPSGRAIPRRRTRHGLG